jgi:hypothetical protein
VTTAELLAQIRNEQTECLEDQVMVLGELLNQRQSRWHRLVDPVRDSHDDTESLKMVSCSSLFSSGRFDLHIDSGECRQKPPVQASDEWGNANRRRKAGKSSHHSQVTLYRQGYFADGATVT